MANTNAISAVRLASLAKQYEEHANRSTRPEVKREYLNLAEASYQEAEMYSRWAREDEEK